MFIIDTYKGFVWFYVQGAAVGAAPTAMDDDDDEDEEEEEAAEDMEAYEMSGMLEAEDTVCYYFVLSHFVNASNYQFSLFVWQIKPILGPISSGTKRDRDKPFISAERGSIIDFRHKIGITNLDQKSKKWVITVKHHNYVRNMGVPSWVFNIFNLVLTNL